MVLRPAAFTIRITNRISVIICWYCFLRFWNFFFVSAAFFAGEVFAFPAGTDAAAAAFFFFAGARSAFFSGTASFFCAGTVSGFAAGAGEAAAFFGI
jgi:hypothetical protein